MTRTSLSLLMQLYHYTQVDGTYFCLVFLWSDVVRLSGGFDTVSETEFSVICCACNSNASSQTSASLMTFFLAMMCYPEVQRKAQGEIDQVVGPDRLPVMSDLDRLPYVQALTWEIFRWRVVVPLGRPVPLSHNARLTSECRGSAQRHG